MTKGEEIAQLSPPTKGTVGRSVSGEEIPCHHGVERGVKAGTGTRTDKDAYGILHYYAGTNGVLAQSPNELAVMDSLVIEGDVGYETGNLEFKGEIVVKGSVQKGYNVKASGDVIIFGHVDGATIAAGGNAIIGEGIYGRKTMVVTRGDVRAQFVNESKLRAGATSFSQLTVPTRLCGRMAPFGSAFRVATWKAAWSAGERGAVAVSRSPSPVDATPPPSLPVD